LKKQNYKREGKVPLFKPVQQKSENVSQKVVRELKSAIAEGKVKPGDKLPPERTLAEMLGVSRNSLREALRLLKAFGLVTIKHGQGVFVAEQNHDLYIANLLKHASVEKSKLAELFEIRKLLEGQAAVWAVERGTEEQIKALAKLVESTRGKLAGEPADSPSILAEQDSLFHNLLAEVTNNSVLVTIMHSLLDLIYDSRCKAMTVPGRQQKSLEEHCRVVEAIQNRKAEDARRAMLTHLQNVEQDVLDGLKD